MEGATQPCFSGVSSDQGYAKRHDPFVYFTHIANTPSMCARIVPYSELSSDLADGQAPSFIWVTPNVCDDGHDCPTSTTDRWLSQNLPPVFSSGWYKAGGVVIITWDEGESNAGCCNGAGGGQIATIVVSAHTTPGARDGSPIDHSGTLATIENLYGLGHLGAAADPASGSLAGLL